MNFAFSDFVAALGWVGSIALPGIAIRLAGRSRPAWPACVALGLLSAYFSFLISTFLGLRFALLPLVGIQVLWSAGIGLLWRLFPPAPQVEERGAGLPATYLLVGGVIVAAFLAGYFFHPLAGPDQGFRWIFLGDQIFRLRTLDFYPPVDSRGMAYYFYCDGFPPFVSVQLAWMNLLAGRLSGAPGWGLLLASLAGTFYYVYRIAHDQGGEKRARYAVIALASSIAVLVSIRSLCDTTVLVPSVLGMAYYLLRAKRDPDHRVENIVLAAAFAVLASQAREYGPAYGLIALGWLLLQPDLRRCSALFGAVLLVFGGAWDLRNLLLTGNPVWSNSFLSFPVNPIHAGIMKSYQEQLMPGCGTAAMWLKVACLSVYGAPFALFGLAECWTNFRQNLLVFSLVATAAALFVISIGATSGGFGSAVRVHAPAGALLCVPAAAWLERLSGRRFVRAAGFLLVGLLLARTTCDLFIFPRSVYLHAVAALRRLPPPSPDAREADAQAMGGIMGHLDRTGIVLTDNAGIASELSVIGVRVWMVWDPRVAFLFEKSSTPGSAKARLRNLGISHLVIGAQNNLNWAFLSRAPMLGSLASALIQSDGILKLSDATFPAAEQYAGAFQPQELQTTHE